MRVIEEAEFRERIRSLLLDVNGKPAAAYLEVGCVPGPGRSGAVAAVYASHILGVPLLPFKTENVPTHLGRLLIIDTAMESGATMRKADRFYSDVNRMSVVCFHEPPRVAFWYEATKPQHFRHERLAA